MPVPDPSDTPDTGRKRQRKMINLDIEETSGVDFPAHMHEGWVVMKSGVPATPRMTAHDHLTDARYLRPRDVVTANALYGAETLEAGETKEIYKGGILGRDACGCLHLTSKATVEKAATESFEKHFTAAQIEGRDQGYMLSKEQVAFMMGVKPEELQ